MTFSVLPRYIGICGNPKSGKSLVQEILKEEFGVIPVDDGEVLRESAMNYFGAKHEDVYTQEGKARPAFWPNGDPIMDYRVNKQMDWRQVLGRLGEQYEDLFGPYIMPMIAVSKLGTSVYSFGSVRKTQGHYFKSKGGIVLGIDNPIAKPTGNAFDYFDPAAIDHWIVNDAQSNGLDLKAGKADLRKKVITLFATKIMATNAA